MPLRSLLLPMKSLKLQPLPEVLSVGEYSDDVRRDSEMDDPLDVVEP